MGIITRAFESRFHPAQDPPDWVMSLGGWTTSAGVTVTPENALQSVAVFACVRVLAETVASLPLIVYRRLEAGGKERAIDHYLFSLLHDLPNPEMTSFELRETLMGHLGTWGNAFAEIEINGAGQALALWPLRPDRMKVRRRNGRLQYVYQLPDSMGAQSVGLPAERILHVRGLGFDGIVGFSPIQLARQAVGLSLATEEFGSRFFGNGARPGAVLEHPGKLSDDAHGRLRESWEERHMGLEKAHRVAILEEGMKLHEVGIPPEDAQFLETRKFQVVEIARLYRVPPHMIGDLERSTFSNIEQQSIEFVTHTIRPWLVRWEQALQRDVFLPSERGRFFTEFLVDGLLRGDIQSRYAAYATGRQWGWFSANDVRRLENMNPVVGGDQYMMPLNMVPVGGRPASSEGVPEGGRALAMPSEERARRLATMRRRLANAHRRVFADTAARILRREINDVRNAAQRFFRRQDFGQFSLWLDEFYRDHQTFIQRQMMPVVMSYGEAVASLAADEVEGEVGMTPALEEFIRAYVEAFAARHIGSSVGQIRSVAREAIRTGEDPVAALDVRFESWEEKRPNKISNWEVIQANNAIAKFIYVSAGILRLRWQAFGENCPYCNRLNGRVVGIQANFLTAGEAFQPENADRPLVTDIDIGHPPAHPGCDCMIVAGR